MQVTPASCTCPPTALTAASSSLVRPRAQDSSAAQAAWHLPIHRAWAVIKGCRMLNTREPWSPAGTGAAGEVGRGAGEGTTVNVPWDGPGLEDGDYMAAFRWGPFHLLSRLQDVWFECCLCVGPPPWSITSGLATCSCSCTPGFSYNHLQARDHAHRARLRARPGHRERGL